MSLLLAPRRLWPGAALLLALQACGPSGPSSPAAASVASVNGAALDAGLLDVLVRARQGWANPFEEEGTHPPPAKIDAKAALDDLVLAEVLAQAAVARGIDRRPEVRAELELQRKTLLGQQLVRELLSEIEVDDAELERRHRERPDVWEYEVSHVLVHNEALARSLIDELDAGTGIESLARRHGADPQSPDGRLGWLMLNQLEQPFAEAVAGLAPGQHAREPVRTSFGWHVVRLQAQRPLPRPPFEEMRATLREQMLQERLQERLAALRAAADVKLADAAAGSGR